MTTPNSDIHWLTAEEQSPLFLETGSSLAVAVDLFQRNADLRLLPIVDDCGRPTGAIFEKDIRRLLLNPFGHALLRNPSFAKNLAQHRRNCPVHEITEDIGALVSFYTRENGREGMVLTRGGRLFATLTNRRLLILAARREHRDSVIRMRRAERIEQAGRAFELHAGTLAEQMIDLANSVRRMAEATLERSTIAGDRAASVASAAIQTRDSMAYVAERGGSLARAFAGIEDSLAKARTVTRETVARVSDGSRKAQDMRDNAEAIDSVMGLVNQIASTVNLLSLNATIEAARAGHAGKGFAVVASEIRKLADQAHEATGHISGQIQAMRAGVAMVADDYRAMESAISAMATSGAAIDHAIRQEADATRHIARNVEEASASSNMIEESVRTIVHSARTASDSARELESLANQLHQGASVLGSEVAAFLGEVRAA